MATETLNKPKVKVDLHPVHYKSLVVKQANLDEKSRTVSGYLAVFGVKDSDSDILIKGCFSKSITDRGPDSRSNRKIAFLWQHKMDCPIGPFTVLREDDYGLYFESPLDDPESVPEAKRAIAQLKSGTLNQFSIGFMYVWDKLEYDENLDAFIVKEVNLFEGSIVTLGANEWTYFAGMKSEQIENVRRELLEETEAHIKLLPPQLQYTTRQLIAKHIALSSNHEPSKETLKENREPQQFDLAQAIKETKFFNP